MELLLLLAVMGLGGLAFFAVWLWMLVEALRIPGQQWTAAGHNQLLYVLAMVFLGILGTLLYVLIPRKDLRARVAA